MFVPPKPPGPMPSEFIFSSISSSRSETQSISLCTPTGLVRACFAIIAAFSKVPPTPTPTTIGGQAFGPASLTAVSIASLTPSIP